MNTTFNQPDSQGGSLDTYAYLAQFLRAVGLQEIADDDRKELEAEQKGRQGIISFSATSEGLGKALGLDKVALADYKALFSELFKRDFTAPGKPEEAKRRSRFARLLKRDEVPADAKGSFIDFMRFAQGSDELGMAVGKKRKMANGLHLSEGFESLGAAFTSILGELEFYESELVAEREKVLHESQGNKGLPFVTELTQFSFPWTRTLVNMLGQIYKGAITGTKGGNIAERKRNMSQLSLQVAEVALHGASPTGEGLFNELFKNIQIVSERLETVVGKTYENYKRSPTIRSHSSEINTNICEGISQLALLGTPYQGPFMLRAVRESHKIQRVLNQIGTEYRLAIQEYAEARKYGDLVTNELRQEHQARTDTLLDILKFYDDQQLQLPEGAVVRADDKKLASTGVGTKMVVSGVSQAESGAMVPVFDPELHIIERKKGERKIVNPSILVEDVVKNLPAKITQRGDSALSLEYNRLITQIAGRAKYLSPAQQMSDEALAHYAKAITHFSEMQAYIEALEQKLLALSGFYSVFANALAAFSNAKTESRDLGLSENADDISNRLTQAQGEMATKLETSDRNIEEIFAQKAEYEAFFIDRLMHIRTSLYTPLIEAGGINRKVLQSGPERKG
jgi:hypothetical protein